MAVTRIYFFLNKIKHSIQREEISRKKDFEFKEFIRTITRYIELGTGVNLERMHARERDMPSPGYRSLRSL